MDSLMEETISMDSLMKGPSPWIVNMEGTISMDSKDNRYMWI